MALIDFYVRNQKLSKNGPKIISGSVNYIDCSFTFKTDDWKGSDKWVVFKKGDETYRADLIDDSIPRESGLHLGEGIWNVSLFGINTNGTKITTNSVTVEIEKGAEAEGESLPVFVLILLLFQQCLGLSCYDDLLICIYHIDTHTAVFRGDVITTAGI